MRKAIKQLDAGESMKRPGGWLDYGTGVLNIAGLALFIIGLAMIVIFLSYNLPPIRHERPENRN